ncbi:MAG: protein translocase subunit SecD [Sedimentisphaerales bacterium]
MDRNVVRFGLIAVVVLVLFAAFELYPPQETLKPGIDLAGGTSLIYEIDTTGLEGGEMDNLAQKLSPILLKRIDPGNVQNIIMRPQGDTRLEIQVPLASADTQARRRAYDEAISNISKDNVNLATIKRTLAKEPGERDKVFAEMAGDSNDRKEILAGLAAAYDARKTAQAKRDALKSSLDTIASAVGKAGVNAESLAGAANLDPNAQAKQIETLVADANSAISKKQLSSQIEQYIQDYKQWAQVVNEMTTPQTGINAMYKQAELKLGNFNLSVEAIVEVLEMPEKSVKRTEMLEQFKATFPSRAEKIDKLTAVFKNYRSVRGRIDGPEDVKRMLKGAGVLEFRILPKLDDGRTNKEEMAGYAESLKTKGPKLSSDSKFVWLLIENPEDGAWQANERNQIITGSFADKYYVLASNQKGECLTRNTGKKPWKLQKAGTTSDQLGKRAIAFGFDEVGASLFYDVTRNNLQRPLCIILDGVAISSPNIRSAIRSSGVIEGDFTQTEQMDMVDKLNAGSLPARLIDPPVSEKTIGPSLGADNRDEGIKAGYLSLLAVAVFLIVYYRIAGLIAAISLALNIFFVLAVMALTRATFTMAGIAGIVLTIGMSDDANILIFERIREELDKGAGLRTAVSNGYNRAVVTILDSNLTTFIPMVILYMVASEEIRGFAITTMLGIVSCMFTAVFVSRIIFHLMLNNGVIIDKLTMLRVIKVPNINWMGMRPVLLTISVIFMTASVFVFVNRDDTKNSKYDIEFTGGTSLQINLKADSPLERADVEKMIREKGEEMGNKPIAAARVYSVGDKEANLQYEITTTETNKTTAAVVFKAGQSQTVQGVTDAINTVQETLRGRLTNLAVSQDSADPQKFVITTSQTNTPIVSRILNKAFGEVASIVPPTVDEIVSRAVKEAFANKLEMLDNLHPQIVSTGKIDDAMVDSYPELANFLGGIKIEFTVDKACTTAQMKQRFDDIRFKPDMEDIVWYEYLLANGQAASTVAGQAETAKDEPSTKFVYYSAEPEAGFRQFSDDEWAQFVNNETKKITEAASLQSSLPRVTQVAPSIGQEAKARAMVATVLSLIAMCIYVWLRFGTLRFGIASLVPLFHDIVVTIGVVVGCTYVADTSWGQKMLIGDFKIDLAMIAAFLTIIGYSMNDTIVVFDRIRENKGRLATITPKIINDSINQTLSRTIITSFTTFFAVLILYVWGSNATRGFSFALMFGIFIGTYSSIAIAAPVLLLWKKKSMTESNK